MSKNDKVVTVCYGERKEWNSREEARLFFLEGMITCEGAESERYARIYSKLISGLQVCTDNEEGGFYD
jgi:hypothetical protein